jgi:hypothetical protein
MRGDRMHKDFCKDEAIVSMVGVTLALIYRILDNNHIAVPKEIVFFLFMFFIAYLFFNRVIKLLIFIIKNKNKFYETTCTVQDIKFRKIKSGGYNYHIVNYTDADKKMHIKEIHSSFSIKKWKIGDNIKIKVSMDDPETIIIPFSDTALAIIMSIIGITSEAIKVAVYLHIK